MQNGLESTKCAVRKFVHKQLYFSTQRPQISIQQPHNFSNIASIFDYTVNDMGHYEFVYENQYLLYRPVPGR